MRVWKHFVAKTLVQFVNTTRIWRLSLRRLNNYRIFVHSLFTRTEYIKITTNQDSHRHTTNHFLIRKFNFETRQKWRIWGSQTAVLVFISQQSWYPSSIYLTMFNSLFIDDFTYTAKINSYPFNDFMTRYSQTRLNDLVYTLNVISCCWRGWQFPYIAPSVLYVRLFLNILHHFSIARLKIIFFTVCFSMFCMIYNYLIIKNLITARISILDEMTIAVIITDKILKFN